MYHFLLKWIVVPLFEIDILNCFLKNTIHCYCLDKFIFFSFEIFLLLREIPFFLIEKIINLHFFFFYVWLFNVFISFFFSFYFLFLIILILLDWWNNQMKQWWYDWNCDYYFFKLKFWCIDFWDLSITHFRQKNSKNCIRGISVIGTFSYFFGIFTNY